MRTLTTTDNPNDLAGRYGPDWRQGVISEHERLFTGRKGNLPSGKRILVAADGSFEPLLCSEVVWIDTEDGRIDGRCGEHVYGDEWACPGHAEQIKGWHAESEMDRIEWERRTEREDALR